MSAVLFFEGFGQAGGMMNSSCIELSLDVLGLTESDMERFPTPDYMQIISHLKDISDPEVRHWIISNTYVPVLRSRRVDAMKAFNTFCSDLGWNVNEIKENMELIEKICELKPVECNVGAMDCNLKSAGTGCFSVIVLIVIGIALSAFTLM